MANYKNYITLFLVFGFLATAFTLKSQTKNDAIEVYNLGVQLVTEDVGEAIKTFNDCLEICNNIGFEGEEIKLQIVEKLPGLYYQNAMSLYKEKKMSEAFSAFEETLTMAEKYEDPATKDLTQNILSQFYNSRGNSFYRNEDYENALASYDKALELNPKFAKPYLYKSLIYKKTEDEENFVLSINTAIEIAQEINDSKTLADTKKTGRDYFLVKGSKALEAKSYQEAVDLLSKSLIYDDKNTGIYFRMAVAYNYLSKWDEAIDAGNKALEFEEEDNGKTAKIYFELGNAYLGKGDNDSACNAYKNASYGAYEEAAKYQIEHVLKCI